MIGNTLEFKRSLDAAGVIFCCSGPFSQKLLCEIGDALRQKMMTAEDNSSVILKVFAVFVEEAQNIIRYSDERVRQPDGEDDDDIALGIIIIGRADDGYYAQCGNVIEKRKVNGLREKLETVRHMDKDQLKEYYREKRREKRDETSRGAGLGLIDIARKSREPIEYEFSEIDNENAFFSFKAII